MSTFNRITVSARLLRAAMTFAAKNDVRYYLNGVFVEPSPDGHGVRLVATDGHRLAVLFDADGSADAPAIIERHKLPTLPRKGGETLATFDGERATYPGGTSLPVSYVDGRFPDWQAVVPDVAQLTGAPGTFNTEYLADLVAVPAAYESKNGAAIHCRDPESSALARFGDLPAFVVLMPLRNGATAPALPDFMRAGEPQRLAIALSARAVELESARMRVHALADVHAGDWRHADARAALLKSGRRWLDMVRRCKRAGLATVSALPFPPDRSGWPQAGDGDGAQAGESAPLVQAIESSPPAQADDFGPTRGPSVALRGDYSDIIGAASEPAVPVPANEPAPPVPDRDPPPVITKARYAKHQMIAHCPGVGLYKSRGQRLAIALRGRYTHREGGFVLSPRKAARLAQLWAAGWDASSLSGELMPPVQAIEPAPPVQATPASAGGDDTGATVTNLADYRATQAAQREICGTQVPEPGQNSPTPAAPRSRGRWDAAAGAWVPVQRAG